MATPILGTESYCMVSGQRYDYKSGTVAVVYARADTNDSEDGDHDHSELGRRHMEVNIEVHAKREVDPHGGPLLLAESGRAPVDFELYEYDGAEPYTCDLSVDRFEVTANPQDSSNVISRRLTGRSKGTIVLPGEVV